MKIGIMGGTFNPIHNAHLMMAQAAYEQYKLMKYGLCHQQNHRTKIRMRLQKKNIENVWFNLRLTKSRILKFQILNIKERGKTYTYDTLVELKKEREDAHFYFIMGGDSLAQFEQWYHPEKL